METVVFSKLQADRAAYTPPLPSALNAAPNIRLAAGPEALPVVDGGQNGSSVLRR